MTRRPHLEPARDPFHRHRRLRQRRFGPIQFYPPPAATRHARRTKLRAHLDTAPRLQIVRAVPRSWGAVPKCAPKLPRHAQSLPAQRKYFNIKPSFTPTAPNTAGDTVLPVMPRFGGFGSFHPRRNRTRCGWSFRHNRAPSKLGC